jgi:hypothetical protein
MAYRASDALTADGTSFAILQHSDPAEKSTFSAITKRGPRLPQDVDLLPRSSLAFKVAALDAMLADVNLDNSRQIPAYLPEALQRDAF